MQKYATPGRNRKGPRPARLLFLGMAGLAACAPISFVMAAEKPQTPNLTEKPSTQSSLEAPATCFPIKTINVQGMALLPEALLRPFLAQQVGRCMNAQDIQVLLKGVKKIYSENGLPQAQVILPDQNIADGILDLIVIESPPAQALKSPKRRMARSPVRKKRRPAPPPPSCWHIRHIRLKGTPLIQKLNVRKTVAPYEGRCLKPADIAKMTAAINALFAAQGYITTYSTLPPQNITTGTLTIKIVEGRVEGITYTETRNGKSRPGPKRKIATALPLYKGDILQVHALEQALAQMNRAPSANANVNIKPGKTVGGSILEFTNTIGDPYRIYGGIVYGRRENFPSKLSGELTLEADNLLDINDTLTLTVSTGNNSNTLQGAFSFPYKYLDFSLSGQFTETLEQISEIADYYKQDASITLAAGWHVLRAGWVNARLQAALSHKWVKSYINDTKLRPQRLSVLGLSATFNVFPDKNLALSLTPGINLGLPILHATKDVDDPTAPKSKFTALLLNASLEAQVTPNMLFSSYWQGQYAFQPLYASEQITMGGELTVRGFDSVAVDADSAFIVQNELRFSLPETLLPRNGSQANEVEREIRSILAGLRPYAFVDFGYAYDKANKMGWTMLGAGAGIRLDWRRISLDVGIARALHRSTHVQKPADFEVQARLQVRIY